MNEAELCQLLSVVQLRDSEQQVWHCGKWPSEKVKWGGGMICLNQVRELHL